MIVKMKNKNDFAAITVYSSLAAFTKHLEKTKDVPTKQTVAMGGTKAFTGTKNFEEALEMLKTGSPDIREGLKKAVKLAVEKLNKELNTQPEGYVADVEGLFFDVARVIEGEPECWYREPWDKVKKPRITIPLLGSYNASFQTEEAIRNASEIIALIKALEDAGFECELAMVFVAEGACDATGKGSYQEVMIKNFDETFNWNKLSAMLHPSFFRRMTFRDIEVALPKTLAAGYGRTLRNTAERFIEGGENFLNIGDHSSIERFKTKTLYTLKGKK
jgi:hypothetical protein